MAHELFGERFLGRRDAAWHKLGTVFPETEKLTATEAFSRAGLDYETIKVPITADYQGTPLPTGQYAVVRGATLDAEPKVLGIVPEDYTIISNMDLAKHFDELTTEWPVETVGALRDGATIFLTLAVGDGEIAKEAVREYFLLTDTRDGKEALRLQYTPVRVVCQNTLSAALRGGTTQMSVPHSANMEADLAFWKELAVGMRQVREETKAALNALAEVKLTEPKLKKLIHLVYPDPPKPKKLAAIEASGKTIWSAEVLGQISDSQMYHQRDRDLMAKHRLQVKTLYERIGDEHTVIAGTAYAFYNAVVEREDHDVRSDSQDISAATATLWGYRQARKQKALDASLVLLK